MSTLITSVSARMTKRTKATARTARKAFENSRKNAATKARRMAMIMLSRMWTIVAKGSFQDKREVLFLRSMRN